MCSNQTRSQQSKSDQYHEKFFLQFVTNKQINRFFKGKKTELFAQF